MKTIKEFKEEQKQLAQQIKQEKKASKELEYSEEYKCMVNLMPLHHSKARFLGRQFRLRHIAYCLLRGRLYDQIEKPKEQNKLGPEQWKEIEKVKSEYSTQDVRVSS